MVVRCFDLVCYRQYFLTFANTSDDLFVYILICYSVVTNFALITFGFQLFSCLFSVVAR